MNPLLLAFTSYFCWGSGDIFGTISTRKLGTYSATLWVNLMSLILFSFYIPFALHDLSHVTGKLFGFSLLLGILFFVGELTFNEACRSSNASLAGTIGASYTVITVILSVILYQESLTPTQVVPILITLFGVILSTLDISALKKRNSAATRGTLLAVVAMICWGSYFALLKPIVRQIGPFWPTYFAFTLLPILYLVIRQRKVKVERLKTIQTVLPIALTALLLRGGDMIFNAAISSGLTSSVAPIAGSYPTLFVVLAFFIFHDPITRQQKAGIAVTLAGIVFLAFSN